MPHPLLAQIVLWLLFSQYAVCAYVQTFSCGSERPFPMGQNSPLAQVVIINGLMVYRLQMTAETTIEDVNITTNAYSTLQVEAKFIGGGVYEHSFRLCDYLSRVNSSFQSDGDDYDYLMSQVPDFLKPFGNGLIEHNITIDPQIVQSMHSQGASCPIQPGERYQILFIARISKNHYFGSYKTRFIMYPSSLEEDDIDCVEVIVSPYHPKCITYPITFFVIFVFIVAIAVNFYVYHHSPNQESDNMFLIMASSICNEPLLNDLTPDPSMSLNFLQFIVFADSLNLVYPGFLQPIISFLNWCVLIRIDVFSPRFVDPFDKDGVYLNWGREGLLGIFPQENVVPTADTSAIMWANFMIWLLICISATVLLSQVFLFVKSKRGGIKQKFINNKSLLYASGIVIQFFYVYFPLPFVAFTSYVILSLIRQQSVGVVVPVLSILCLTIWLSGIIWFIFHICFMNKHKLYSSFKIISIFSPLYNWYKPSYTFFILFSQGKIILEGAIFGLLQVNGTVQISLLLVIEIIHQVLLIWYQPFFNKVKNYWCVWLNTSRIIVLIINTVNIGELNASMAVRSILADIQLVIVGLVMIMFLVFSILRLVQIILRNRRKLRSEKISRKLTDTKEDPQINECRDSDDDDNSIDAANDASQPSVAYSDDGQSASYEANESIHLTPSIRSFQSSEIQLTDSRALPGLSLKYVTNHGPTAANSKKLDGRIISPITEDYLRNLKFDWNDEDYEVQNLWEARLKRRAQNVSRTNSVMRRSLSSFRKANPVSTESSVKTTGEAKPLGKLNRFARSVGLDVGKPKETGFAVIGRKPIVVEKDSTESKASAINSSNTTICKNDVDISSDERGSEKAFKVMGRKPIVVNYNAKMKE